MKKKIRGKPTPPAWQQWPPRRSQGSLRHVSANASLFGESQASTHSSLYRSSTSPAPPAHRYRPIKEGLQRKIGGCALRQVMEAGIFAEGGAVPDSNTARRRHRKKAGWRQGRRRADLGPTATVRPCRRNWARRKRTMFAVRGVGCTNSRLLRPSRSSRTRAPGLSKWHKTAANGGGRGDRSGLDLARGVWPNWILRSRSRDREGPAAGRLRQACRGPCPVLVGAIAEHSSIADEPAVSPD